MTTIKDASMAFIPKTTKNIADLEVVSIDAVIYPDGIGSDETGKEFTYSYLLINDEEYRVPNSVLTQLKELLQANPNLTKFKVKKSGEGLKTRYTVIPIL